MGVVKRSHKDAVKLAWKNNKLEFKNVHIPNNTHKQGWHKTWNGKDVFIDLHMNLSMHSN